MKPLLLLQQQPNTTRRYDTTSRAADTRARLEEAARKRAEEERAKAAQRHQRRDYKTGQLTGAWGGMVWVWLGVRLVLVDDAGGEWASGQDAMANIGLHVC